MIGQSPRSYGSAAPQGPTHLQFFSSKALEGNTNGSMNNAKRGHRFKKTVRSDKEQYLISSFSPSLSLARIWGSRTPST